MGRKSAFISFDYDHDEFLKIALVGQAKNDDSPFDFRDASLQQALTGDWKKKVQPKIEAVDVMIVICGEHTDTAAGVSAELAIAQEVGKDYFLLWGYAGKTCVKPMAAKSTDKVYKWEWDTLKRLIAGER
jgi:hypothetical protein